MLKKPPSILGIEKGFTTNHSWSRDYCRKCKSVELHKHCECVQCGSGGIPMGKVDMHFNNKRRS